MTNKSTRIRSGKKPRLRLLDLAFEQGSGSPPTEVIDFGKRPHGGYKGSKKHPLSPYSYNKDPAYLREISGEVDRIYHDQFVEDHRSPGWAVDTHKETTHSGESPLFIHGLLSSSKHDPTGRFITDKPPTPLRGRSAPPKRSGTLYYRPNSTHQYLSATELRQTTESEVNIKYGRPTRTTLLRARQRSNSAPVSTYMQRKETIRKAENQRHINTKEKPLSKQRESTHGFLTGARYNRAHLLDSKGLTVYGVYMPRNNPLACFMTGVASTRLKERGDEVPSAPPESPRSDLVEFPPELVSQQCAKRPATAPGKRLLSAKVLPKERPKSAWGDATTTCDILQNESENLEYADLFYRNQISEEFILIPNVLNVQGNKIVVSLRSSRQSLRGSESRLPSVTGISVPKVNFRRTRDPVDETSLVNQPPPTPIGGLSRDESDRVRKASISVTKNSSISEEIRKDVTKVQNPQLVDKSMDPPTEKELDALNNETDELVNAEMDKENIVNDKIVDTVNNKIDEIVDQNSEAVETKERSKEQKLEQLPKDETTEKQNTDDVAFFLTEESKNKDDAIAEEDKSKEFKIGVTVSSTEKSETEDTVLCEAKVDSPQ